MAKYVIHKIGFFYTDEAYEAVEDALGSIVGTYSSLEEAKQAKKVADVLSLQNQAGENLVNFFFDNPDFDLIFDKIQRLYLKEWSIIVEDKYWFALPKEINTIQAQSILDITQITFHSIVEYEDAIVLDAEAYDLEELELSEF